MRYSEVSSSIVVGESNYIPLSSDDTHFPTDLKDKIIQLEKTQSKLKLFITQTDVALKSPFLEYRQNILKSTFQKEKKQYQIFLTQYKNLNSKERRPYQTMFRKFKQKISEHQQQIRMANQSPLQHKKKLQSIRQVWFENEQTEEQQWKFLLRGFIGIFGAFLFHVLIGAISRYGIINGYVTSFYKFTTDPHLQTKYNSFASPLTMLCSGITMKLGFKLCNQLGPIKVMIFCVVCMAVSVLCVSFVDQFIQFIIFNNVIYGIFAGAIFICPMKQCHKYFPKYRLVCNSIILVGTGIGSVFFGVLNTDCMNLNHQSPMDTGYFTGQKDYIAKRLPMCWTFMSIVVLVIGIIAAICFYPMTVYNRKQEQIKLQKGQLPNFENSCYTDQQALKSGVFWVLAALILCSGIGNYYMTSNFKNTVKTQKDPIMKTQKYLDLVLLTGAIIGALFRLFWGIAFPVLGFKFLFITAVSLDFIVYSLFISIQITQFSYMVIFAMHCIAQGGYSVIFPNTCLLVFGDIIGQSIYGFYWVFFSLTHFCQYFISVKIVQINDFVKNNINQSWARQNPYKIVFVPYIIMCLIGLTLCIVKKFQGRWENSLKLLTFKIQ